MSFYRNQLPQLAETPFLTDGGLETTIIFENGIDLPEFAAFPLLQSSSHRDLIKNYYKPYIDIAVQKKVGFVLESPTWRASIAWGAKLGFTEENLVNINREAIKLLSELRNEFSASGVIMPISGCIGPRGDGYTIETKMSAEQARQYHTAQIWTFAETEADFVTALTINYVEEAIGIAQAARDQQIPVVISFTVETDGRLPSGQPLRGAIEEVDKATNNTPVYYMINCAHPTHFASTLAEDGDWLQRIRGVRANASCKSHQELDEATELDRGDEQGLANDYKELATLLPSLTVVGGCCGTDCHHIEKIAESMQINH